MTSTNDTASQRSSSGYLGGIVIILIVFIFGAVTNPDMNQHQRTIGSHVEAESPLIDLFGAGDLAGGIAGSMLTYNDYAVFSTTTHERKIVTIGVAGQVFLREELVDKVDNMTDKQGK